VASDGHRALIEKGLNGMPILGFISQNDKILESDIQGRPAFTENNQLLLEVRQIKNKLEECVKV